MYRDGEKICENSRLFVEPKYFDLNRDDFSWKIEKVGDRYALKIQTQSLKKRFAIWSKLDVEFSDNYFDLLDSDEKTVYIYGAENKSVEEIKDSLSFYSL